MSAHEDCSPQRGLCWVRTVSDNIPGYGLEVGQVVVEMCEICGCGGFNQKLEKWVLLCAPHRTHQPDSERCHSEHSIHYAVLQERMSERTWDEANYCWISSR